MFGDSGSWGWVAGAGREYRLRSENHLFHPRSVAGHASWWIICSMGIDVGGGSSATVIFSGVGFFILWVDELEPDP